MTMIASSILWLCFCMTSFLATNVSTSSQNHDQRIKDCALVTNDTEIAEIRRLLVMEHVNMIDLQLYSGPKFDELLFPFLQMTFANADGRIIMSILDIKYLIVTWTLNAGRRRFDLHVGENPKGCIQAQKDRRNFVSGNLLKHFVGNVQTTACEVCYMNPKVGQSHQTRRTCCKMTEKFLSKYQCNEDEHQNQYFNLLFLPNIPLTITTLALAFTFTFCFISLVQTPHKCKMDGAYYYLSETTISIFCFFRYIFVNDHGAIITQIRKFTFVCLTFYLYYTHFQHPYLHVMFGYWALFFPFFNLWHGPILSKDEHRQHIRLGTTCSWCSKLGQLLQYDDIHKQLYSLRISTEVERLMLLISLPFNIKHWEKIIKKSYDTILQKLVILKYQSKNSLLNSLQKYGFRLVTTSLCFLYIPVAFVLIIFLIISILCTYTYKTFNIVLDRNRKNQHTQYTAPRYRMLRSLHEVLILVISLILIGVVCVFTWLPFFFGLLFNLIYYLPYITVVSVSTFYFVQFWKSIDSKYIALRMFIYEEYRDRMKENNDATIESQNESGPTVPVVSQKLYHKVRERVLPYHTNLCGRGYEVLLILTLSSIFVYTITALQKFNATPFVKVMTTLSVSVLPYIFNSVSLKLSEEEKRAWDEELRLNVRRVVGELIAEDPQFGETVLAIRPYNEEIIGSRGIDTEDSEHDVIIVMSLPTHISPEPQENVQYETST